MTASFQKASANRKLAPVRLVPQGSRFRPEATGPYCSSTYVSMEATCPDVCTFKNNGCYADSGATYNGSLSLDERARAAGASGLDVIRKEALEVDRAFPHGVPQDGARGGRDLRLHVAGDVSCPTGALELAAAARRWKERGGGTVWCYTHRWRDIPIGHWEGVSVLASIERTEDLDVAHRHGYAAALTVVAFPSIRAFTIPGSGHRLIPCPAQTKGVTCIQCRLCLNPDRLHSNRLAIGFAVHGRDAKIAKRALRVVQGGTLDAVPLELYNVQNHRRDHGKPKSVPLPSRESATPDA